MQSNYNLAWSSSTSPPVTDPFAFAAYGYASCSGWATFITYMARAVGIPARQVGTPCWNQPLGGIDYSGLARDNPNVSLCWHGGIGSPDGSVGGNYLNNHNWVEYWDSQQATWCVCL
jgi:transglutaminase-like putative cysteine protease